MGTGVAILIRLKAYRPDLLRHSYAFLHPGPNLRENIPRDRELILGVVPLLIARPLVPCTGPRRLRGAESGNCGEQAE